MGQDLLRFFLMNFTKVYKTLKLVPDKIPETEIKWSFGKWRHSLGLPVWRRGNVLICPKFLRKYTYTPSKIVLYKKKGDSYYTSSNHRNLNIPEFVWRRDIRKKLRRFGLSWIKPRYDLPIWLSMYIFNYDVFWKTKWDDVRFEFPPQFTIVIFGWSLMFWVVPKKKFLYKKGSSCDIFWWENVLRKAYGY